MTAMVENSGERVLRIWGSHWKARLSGCSLENLSVEPDEKKDEGDVLKEIEAMKALHPRLTFDEAKELIKYQPFPRNQVVSPPPPGMAQIEMTVSRACKDVGEKMWERFCREELGGEPEDFPNMTWRGRGECVRGVRYLIRNVYVCGIGVRSPKYPRSEFDRWYPFAQRSKDRTEDGKLSTLRQVRDSV